MNPQRELFAKPAHLAGMGDAPTSHEAAAAIADELTELQTRVLTAFQELGPMSARQLERLPRFQDLAPSTARKRCTELMRLGRLQPCGMDRESGRVGSTIWKAVV